MTPVDRQPVNRQDETRLATREELREAWASARFLNETLTARVRDLEAALRYACGYDVAGWESHMRPDEILAKVGVAPFPSFTDGAALAPAEKEPCDYCRQKGREWTPECEDNKAAAPAEKPPA